MAGIMMKVFFVMVACMVVSAPHAEAAITCGQVVSKLVSCLGYLQTGGTPTPACCSGVTSLNAAAQSTPDRQAACNCLKSSYSSYPGISPANAASLPGKCGVNIPYKISPSTDCSSVH
ncbi:putative plant non-specific lipid-transfer protein/Par allergen [Helianthus annuus]|nr:putative plant non-specific lipid-transfer protein/Par allergen [Helianthus annuus]